MKTRLQNLETRTWHTLCNLQVRSKKKEEIEEKKKIGKISANYASFFNTHTHIYI